MSDLYNFLLTLKMSGMLANSQAVPDDKRLTSKPDLQQTDPKKIERNLATPNVLMSNLSVSFGVRFVHQGSHVIEQRHNFHDLFSTSETKRRLCLESAWHSTLHMVRKDSEMISHAFRTISEKRGPRYPRSKFSHTNTR